MSRWIHVIFNRQVPVLQEDLLKAPPTGFPNMQNIPGDFVENIETERAGKIWNTRLG
jgi:hypothetical protein